MAEPVRKPEEDDEDAETPEEAGEALRVGDLAIVPYAQARERIGCGTEVGLVVEDRRSVVKVLFPGIDRTFWLERDVLSTVSPERLPVHPLAERLHRIVRLVGADLIEFYDATKSTAVFHVYTRGMDLDRLVRLRESLGADLERIRVEPGGMRRLRLNLSLRLP